MDMLAATKKKKEKREHKKRTKKSTSLKGRNIGIDAFTMGSLKDSPSPSSHPLTSNSKNQKKTTKAGKKIEERKRSNKFVIENDQQQKSFLSQFSKSTVTSSIQDHPESYEDRTKHSNNKERNRSDNDAKLKRRRNKTNTALLVRIMNMLKNIWKKEKQGFSTLDSTQDNLSDDNSTDAEVPEDEIVIDNGTTKEMPQIINWNCRYFDMNAPHVHANHDNEEFARDLVRCLRSVKSKENENIVEIRSKKSGIVSRTPTPPRPRRGNGRSRGGRRYQRVAVNTDPGTAPAMEEHGGLQIASHKHHHHK